MNGTARSQSFVMKIADNNKVKAASKENNPLMTEGGCDDEDERRAQMEFE